MQTGTVKELVYADSDTMGIVTGMTADEANNTGSDSGESQMSQYLQSPQHRALVIMRIITIVAGVAVIGALGYMAIKINREMPVAETIREMKATKELELMQQFKDDNVSIDKDLENQIRQIVDWSFEQGIEIGEHEIIEIKSIFQNTRYKDFPIEGKTLIAMYKVADRRDIQMFLIKALQDGESVETLESKAQEMFNAEPVEDVKIQLERQNIQADTEDNAEDKTKASEELINNLKSAIRSGEVKEYDILAMLQSSKQFNISEDKKTEDTDKNSKQDDNQESEPKGGPESKPNEEAGSKDEEVDTDK